MRIIFAGTPEFAAGHLQYLIDQPGYEIVAVLTQPDRPSGRGQKLTPSPVKELAHSRQLPVLQPETLRQGDIQQELCQLQPDIIIVVAYGLILPKAVLSIPRHGCLNVHASLLPRWRGAAPIQRAIEAGDTESGITIMQMDAGLDTGDMLLKVSCPIEQNDTASSLHDKLLQLGGPALQQVLEQIRCEKIRPEKQDDTRSTYAAKISKVEAQINWQQPAEVIGRKIRAFNPFPIAFFMYGQAAYRVHECRVMSIYGQPKRAGEIVSVSSEGIDVAAAAGIVRIMRLQLPGKKAMSVNDVLNGHPNLFNAGSCLS